MNDGEKALVEASGETYVLYQLYRRGLLAAPAPSGAAIADLIVFDPRMSVGSMIQVLTATRAGGHWFMGEKNERVEHVHPRLFYALVDLEPDPPTVHIVPSAVVADVLQRSHEAFIAGGGQDHPMRRLGRRTAGYAESWLDEYLDRWDLLSAEPVGDAG